MPTSLRTVAASRYVTPFREGGSLPALLEADVVKALADELAVSLVGLPEKDT